MRQQIIGLGSLMIVLSAMLLRATALVAISMGVLWLIGKLFPHVALALGFPHTSLYELLTDLVGSFNDLASWVHASYLQ